MKKPPKVNYTTTIVGTGETHERLVDDVMVMMDHVTMNLFLASVTYDKTLVMEQPVIDPVTDELSFDVKWEETGEVYLKVKAQRIDTLN